jgi:hypothetical protein
MMDRRELLGALGIGAVGLMAGSARAQDESHPHEHDKATEDCLKACRECAGVCEEMFNHCFQLVEQGKKDHSRSARLSLDCAAFCGFAACLMGRHSELSAEACTACAEACEKCGSECAKFDSRAMQHCAKVCKDCAEACRKMVQSMRGANRAAAR